jgi:hypothetical protein
MKHCNMKHIFKSGIMNKWNFALLVVTPLAFNMYSYAQESIDKEVVVIKPYKPVLSDANKINILPEINDTASIKPTFVYKITPKKYETEYEVKKIKAATLGAESIGKLYKSYLSLGVGNYFVPDIELNINSLRSRDKWFGVYIKHNSINGKIKLDNNLKVNPGSYENIALVEGKKIFKKSILSGFISPELNGVNFYGYNPVLDTIMPKDSIRQHYLYASAGVRIQSANKDSMHLNYDLGFNYGYARDRFDFSEHAFRFTGDFNKQFRNQVIGLNSGISYYNTPVAFDSVSNTVVHLQPWFSRSSPEFTYRIGVNLLADIYGDDVNYHVYPVAYLQISLLNKIMVPYFGIEGGLEENNFSKISRENMYIMPGLSVKNTNHKIIGYIGLKGNYYSKLSYHLGFNYTISDGMYFFINDTVGAAGNKFLVEYDNAERVNFLAEMIFRPLEKLSFTVKGNYYHYNLDSLEYAWHKPSADAGLFAEYNIKNKLLFEGSIIYIGPRYARYTDGTAVKLDGYTDLGLGLEYRYSKVLSAFIRFNNILGMKQEPWLFYPGMRLNALFGFTYSL